MRTNLIILCIVSTTMFVFAEGSMRALNLVENYSDRVLFFSEVAWVGDAIHGITYPPNKKIRSVAVYGDQVEYDVTFETNNLGFVDHEDYELRPLDAGNSQYVFVGDSVTAGFHGGSAWVPQLREDLRKENKGLFIYNLGVGGLGIRHFLYLLESVADKISYSNLVILAISEDFERYLWSPLSIGKSTYGCLDGASPCSKKDAQPMAYGINFYDTQATLVERARQIYKKANKPKPSRIKQMLKQSHFLLGAVRAVRTLSRSAFKKWDIKAKWVQDLKQADEGENLRVRQSVEALRSIRQRLASKKIFLIHLPEKSEVKNKRYRINLQEEAKELDMHYYPALEECEWDINMFHKIDGHYNHTGNQSLSRCISNYLFEK